MTQLPQDHSSESRLSPLRIPQSPAPFQKGGEKPATYEDPALSSPPLGQRDGGDAKPPTTIASSDINPYTGLPYTGSPYALSSYTRDIASSTNLHDRPEDSPYAPSPYTRDIASSTNLYSLDNEEYPTLPGPLQFHDPSQQSQDTYSLTSAVNIKPLPVFFFLFQNVSSRIPVDDEPVIPSSSPAYPRQNYVVERGEVARSAYIQVDGKLQKLRHRHKLTPDQWQLMYCHDEIRGRHIRIELFTHLAPAAKVTMRYLGLLFIFAGWVVLLYGMIHIHKTGWKVVTGVAAAVVWVQFWKLHRFNFVPGTTWHILPMLWPQFLVSRWAWLTG